MKTIGLLGGMSWESSLHYYRLVNERVRERLGGLHSAPLVMVSVDFEAIERMQKDGRWDEAGRALAEAARQLERAGAECVVLCTNTMHKVASAIESAIRIPLLHIADATAAELMRRRISRAALLGTRFTMEEPFYRERLEQCGITVEVPEAAERDRIHRVIYDELCLGRAEPQSRDALKRIAAGLVARGAEGIILGCTELMLILSQADVPAPLFDTTSIHAAAAVDWALG